MNSNEVDHGTARLETFSDGLFAIVITLLVLDLRLPELPEPVAAFTLQHELMELWPSAAAFFISFVNIFILWVIHHELMRITTRADTGFLYLNGGLLFGVAILPFSTALAAEHALGPGANLAAALYTGVFLWIAAFYNLVWRYVAAHPERIVENVTPRDRRRITITYGATLILYACAFVLSFTYPLLSIGVTLALALFFAIADRLSGFASEDIANEED